MTASAEQLAVWDFPEWLEKLNDAQRDCLWTWLYYLEKDVYPLPEERDPIMGVLRQSIGWEWDGDDFFQHIDAPNSVMGAFLEGVFTKASDPNTNEAALGFLCNVAGHFPFLLDIPSPSGVSLAQIARENGREEDDSPSDSISLPLAILCAIQKRRKQAQATPRPAAEPLAYLQP